MLPRVLFGLLASLGALAWALPAGAQIYKWVDEHGVAHYSDRRPEDAESARKLDRVEDRVSVYTPDGALRKAMAAPRPQPVPAQAEVARDPLRLPPPPPLAAAAASPADPCIYVDCHDAAHDGYVLPPAYGPARRAPRLVQAVLPAGATAGNVHGMNSYIPGNSTSAAARFQEPPRFRGRGRAVHRGPLEPASR